MIQADEPPGHQHALPAEPVSKSSGSEVRKGLGEAERRDKRQDGRTRSNAELDLGRQRQDRAFEAYHAADKGIDEDEQHELPPVLPESESNEFHSSSDTPTHAPP